MAASSQGDEEEEERKDLERELATELTALTAGDVEFDVSWNGEAGQSYDVVDWAGRDGGSKMDYVRLDLNKVLQQVATTSDERQDLHGQTWELLLQSVERSDREFFQPCHEKLSEIRTSILQVEASQQQVIAKVNKETTQPSLQTAETSQPEQSPVPNPVDECRGESDTSKLNTDTRGNSFEPQNLLLADECQGATTIQELNVDTMVQTLVGEDVVESPVPNSLDNPTEISSFAEEEPQTIAIDPNDDESMRKELQAIEKQHEARRLRRVKAQARYEKEQAEAAQLLLQLQEEFETQERNAATTRREAQERSLMTNEEVFCRQFAAAEREKQEYLSMSIADNESRHFAVELTRLQEAIDNEIILMEIEDRAVRNRMKMEWQKQKAAAKCHFSAVLLRLVNYHETQRQIQAHQMKRERRECVEMRAEEAQTWRLIAELHALRERQERERNQTLMTDEDNLSKVFEQLQRQQKREEDCRAFMAEEEKRSRLAWIFIVNLELVQKQNEERSLMKLEEERCRCAWKYLSELEAKEREIHRLRALSNFSTGFQKIECALRQYAVITCFEKWMWWTEKRIEEENLRSAAEFEAATRIQIWHRSRRKRQQFDLQPPFVLEDFSDEEQPQVEDDEIYANSPQNQEAALRLQSTFRGFHVRRKFANAIALAQVVGEHEDGEFNAVDLDDLIELPPELVEGWEDPVLPPSSVLSQRQYPEPESSEHEEVRANLDNNNAERIYSEELADTKPLTPPEPKKPAKEQTLAAILWNKMKRVKQRQQYSQQERKRQQDPIYRVRKLLNGKSNGTNQSHGCQTPQGSVKVSNMVSWSSNNNAKKKPKVKLPSLVERLRKQTMAER
ncbi:hypothetical protein P3T76_004885 [Phytophthora citrophthora]|uniref:Uncharacterized protein n=1 Tax=Phytophthora citrophthora TaxID=4793 RepID=A0AAD9GRZ6_9STRA|nr:hypothetical protein P3T76_004885 [Phytophthora citrophthora]